MPRKIKGGKKPAKAGSRKNKEKALKERGLKEMREDAVRDIIKENPGMEPKTAKEILSFIELGTDLSGTAGGAKLPPYLDKKHLRRLEWRKERKNK